MSGLPKGAATVQFGQPDENGYEIVLTVAVPSPALYVHLTTLASGRFSENSFSLVSTLSKNVTFTAIGSMSIDVDLLKSSLRVEHLGQYLK